MYKNIKFAWVQHNSARYIKSVLYTLNKFRPEIIGLEVSKEMMLQKLSMLFLIRLFISFTFKNISYLLTFKKPKKINSLEIPKLREVVVDERDQRFVRKITTLISKNMDKKIVFIIGKAPKQGITGGLKCY